MKQLIEEQKKQFEEISERQIFLLNGKKGTLKNTIIYESLLNWHKQSLKQFIDELIAREESIITGIGLLDDSNLSWTWDVAKKNTIAHLKELKEELN